MDVDNAPPVDTVAMAAAAFAFTAKRELASSSLPASQQIGNLHASGHVPPQASASAAAVAPPPEPAPAGAQSAQLGPAAANAPAGRDENVVRALALAEDARNGVRKGTANDTATATGSAGGGRAEGEDSNVSALEEIVVRGAGLEADVPLARYGEPAVPSAAAAGGRVAGDAAPRSIGGSLRGVESQISAQPSGNVRSLAASAGASGGSLTKSEDGVASASGSVGSSAGSAAGSAGEEDDVGSGDEDNDDYTWFSSERRVTGGERKHGRGRLGGDKVYDRIQINDNAEVSVT